MLRKFREKQPMMQILRLDQAQPNALWFRAAKRRINTFENTELCNLLEVAIKSQDIQKRNQSLLARQLLGGYISDQWGVEHENSRSGRTWANRRKDRSDSSPERARSHSSLNENRRQQRDGRGTCRCAQRCRYCRRRNQLTVVE